MLTDASQCCAAPGRDAAKRSASVAQNALRAAVARKHHLSRRVLVARGLADGADGGGGVDAAVVSG